MPEDVTRIYCVDDGCPDGTGRYIEDKIEDQRVRVLYHDHNRGVGATTKSGYRAALADGMEIIVKLDGDGQMDPAEIPHLLDPILSDAADYTKGNRFRDLKALRQMPRVRLFGNSVLTFLVKAASGYWQMMDPTNGYTAINRDALAQLDALTLSGTFDYQTCDDRLCF